MSASWNTIHSRLLENSSKLRFQRSFKTLQRDHDVLKGFADPAALLDMLHREGPAADDKNSVLAVLARAAKADTAAADDALVLVLLALWPGLDGIRRRALARRGWSRPEIASEMLARATEAIRSVDLDRVTSIAATILRNIERDLTRARRTECERHAAHSAVDPDTIPAQDPGATVGELHSDLRRIVDRDAELVIRIAVDGYTQAEAADEIGASYEAVRKRYQRAAGKLRSSVQEICWGVSHSGG